MKNINKKTHSQGYITLISMLIIAVIGTSLVATTLFNGVGSFKTSLSFEQSAEARMLANACAEEALEKIWKADDYTGSGSLMLGKGSCSYSVSGSSIPKSITASGAVGPVVRRISVTVDQLHPYVSANPWQEVP